MHAIEKILAKNSGRAEVHTGEIVTAKVDFAEINDLYLQTVYSFYEMGGEKVWNRERAAFVFDHYAPCPDIKSAANHKEMREFAKKNDLRFHFDTNCGVCHQVMPEAGVIYPGMIVVATDSHTTTHGAFGAMGTGCGATDMATILMTGELWFRVPEIIEVRLDGEAQKGVYPKDVILEVLGRIRADGAVYKAIDFTGSYVEKLNVAGRMTICNMAVEMGAKTAYMQPNADVLNYVDKRAVRPYEVQFTDPDFQYEESLCVRCLQDRAEPCLPQQRRECPSPVRGGGQRPHQAESGLHRQLHRRPRGRHRHRCQDPEGQTHPRVYPSDRRSRFQRGHAGVHEGRLHSGSDECRCYHHHPRLRCLPRRT